MAIQKEIITNLGVTVSYFIVTLLQVDKFSKTAYMKLGGFVDKETREKPLSQYIISKEYSIYPLEFDNVFNYTEGKNERQQAYDYIKVNDKDFIDALDA